MPDNSIIIDNDLVHFLPTFGLATVVAAPVKISGTGKPVAGQKICVEGDEKSIKVQGTYTTPAFPTAGAGTLVLGTLKPDQLTQKTTCEGKKIILRGAGYFMAKFEVQAPASNPPAGTTDAVTSYPGQGKFINANSKVTAK
jgi:hypothetical protein